MNKGKVKKETHYRGMPIKKIRYYLKKGNVCPFCVKPFKTEFDLAEHLAKHHEKDVLKLNTKEEDSK